MKLKFKRIIVSLVAIALICGALFQPIAARAATLVEYALLSSLIAQVASNGKFDPKLVPQAKSCFSATANSAQADAKTIEAYSNYQVENLALQLCKKTASDQLECASAEMKVGILKNTYAYALGYSTSVKSLKSIECAKPSKSFENVGQPLS